MNPLEKRLAKVLEQQAFDKELEHAVTLAMKIGSHDFQAGLVLMQAIGGIGKNGRSDAWTELIQKIEELWAFTQQMENDK